MGVGKTVCALTIIKEANMPTLIVAPKLIAETVWIQEARKWEHLSTLKISLIAGSPATRSTVLNNPTDIVVIGIDNFPWLVDQFEKKPWPFKMLVLDESSRWKDPSTVRFKALKKVIRNTSRRIIMTGTPTPNGLQDIWAQVAILDLGDRLGKSLTAFRNTYLIPDKMNPHTRIVYKWKAKPGAQEIVEKKIADICYSLRAEDYLEMPRRNDIEHSIPWDNKSQYDQMLKDMVLDYDGETFTAQTAATLVNKLLQMTGGSLYNQEGESIDLSEEKLRFTQTMLEDFADPAIIFYHYKASLRKLQANLPEAQTYSPEILDDWRVGKVKILLLHPQSAGLGLNLQCNVGNLAHIMWYDLPWSSELYLQANARIYRQGQEKPVMIHHLMMEGSIDQKVLAVLQGKITLQDALIKELSL